MTHYLETLATLATLASLMWGMMKFMLKDIHKELADIRQDVSEIKQNQQRTDARVDHLYEENNRLYRVLVDLVQKK